LYLGEIYGKVTVDNNPALNALRKVRQGMDQTAEAGKRSTDKLEAQAQRHEKAVNDASDGILRARRREQDAAAAVVAAEKKLADARRKHAADSSQVVEAERRAESAHRRVADAQDASARATRDLDMAQRRAVSSSRDLSVANERVRTTTRRTSGDFTRMTNDMNTSSRAGRTFTASIAMVTAGLTAVTPAAGAAGAGLLAGAGHVLTLASSLGQLAGVAALIPAGFISIGAGAGVLVAALSGVGDALKAVNAETSAFTANPRLAAMAVEDALAAITMAEENAAAAQVAASRAVEAAERREADAARGVIDAQRDLVEAREEAAARVNKVGSQVFDAHMEAKDTAIAYRKALAEYNKAKAEGKTGDELDSLNNTVNKLYAANERAIESEAELRKEHAKAKKEAKAGSEAVLKAEQRLADAQQAHLDAQQAIKDAAAQAKQAQVDSARAVAQAHRNLERVQLQQADTAARAGHESAEAMGELTPAAQEAVRALLQVKDTLSGIRRIAQENFFTGFSAPLLALSGALGPQMATGVGAIASALGAGAQQFMASLQSSLGSGVLERLLRGVAESIEILNRAIDPIVQSFITLGIVGMDYMPRLAGWVADLAEQFNSFIQAAAADGSLKRWIDDGIQGMKDLWSIGDSVLGIFSSLTSAAMAGGINTTLGGLAAGLRDVDAAMGGEAFQTTMATIFAGAQAGAEGLLAALGPIGEAFRTGSDSLARFLELSGEIAGLFIGGLFTALSDPAFGAGLITFFEGVRDGVAEIAPKLPALFAAFGDILGAIAPVVEALGPTTVDVLTIFAQTVANILTELSPLLEALAGSPVAVGIFLGVIGAASLLGAIANFITHVKVLTGAFKLLWLAITGPIGLVILAIGALVAAQVWFFTETELGRTIIQRAWIGINLVVKSFLNWFNGVFLPNARNVLQWFGDKFNWLWKNVINPVMTWIGDTISVAWTDVIKPVFDKFGSIVRGIPDAFEAAKKGIKTAWDAIQGIAKAPVKFVVETVINDGLIKTFNKIPGVKIPEVKLPKGFKDGGYTGDGAATEVAGPAHRGEYYFTKDQTARIGKDKLAALAHGAARIDSGPVAGAFMGNRNAIAQHGAYFMNVAAGMGPWNFKGAANMWDGAAGVKVKTGRGKHQGYVTQRERGGGILGYTTGTNIDMSPSWMAQLGAVQRRTVAAHEIGHALGLPHSNASSIMAPHLGAMASVPTANDIRNLQRLYPGGTGKPGEGQPDNPFQGMVAQLVGLIKKQFPGGGMFVDAGVGIATSGIDSVIKFVSDIANNIGNLVGDITDGVVGGIRDFFGGGAAMAPTLMDGGGWLYDTDGPTVVHQKKKPDAFTPYDEWQQMKADYANAAGGEFTGNLYLEGGEFLGKVRGVVRKEIDQQVRVASNTRRGI
jgi:hypothetical protein